jgi:cytochrome P450
VLTQCSYGWTYDYIRHPEWAMNWKLVNTGGRASAAIVRSFPLIGAIVRSMPLWLAIKLVPPVGFMKSWMQRVGQQVAKIKADPETMAAIKTDTRRKETIFAQILSSDLPEAELSDERLVDEGVLIATAGSETTAWAITITTYHVMQNPAVLTKLRAELASVPIPPSCAVAGWPALEKLPYLTAVIKEGVRLAGGMLSRLPRIYDKPITYKEWTIPAGTPIAMTPHLILIDENIFPDPRVFRPERWIDDPKAPGVTSRLDKYIVAFGKGSRNCIGMHLAYAQLFMCVAAVAGRYTLEMFETDESDVTPSRDLFTAGVKVESRGIRVMVHGRDE